MPDLRFQGKGANTRVLAQLRVLRLRCEFNSEYCGFRDEHWRDCTAEVAERTRLYRESWILPAIDELIEYFEGKITARQLNFTER